MGNERASVVSGAKPAAQALEEIDSPLHRLRAALHLEVAKADYLDESFPKACAEVRKGLALDYTVPEGEVLPPSSAMGPEDPSSTFIHHPRSGGKCKFLTNGSNNPKPLKKRADTVRWPGLLRADEVGNVLRLRPRSFACSVHWTGTWSPCTRRWTSRHQSRAFQKQIPSA